VRVAAVDVTGDGKPELITGTGPGGGPHVRILDATNVQPVHELLAFDPAVQGGVFVG
jgi:hypothetical protein